MKRFHFDAVVFDLDGTLVASERTWPDAGRAALLRFLASEGAPRLAIPSPAGWMAMVGQPLDEALAEAFPELEAADRAELERLCRDEEQRAVGRGRAAILPGATEVLAALRADGVRVGVASNCGPDYLDAMVRGLGLDAWVEEARCLASPGISNKADMIEDLSLTFGTRSLVMVGDRRGDRDSAWANGFPFVYVPRGYGGSMHIAAEGTLDGIDELPALLAQRTVSLDEVLGRVPDGGSLAVEGLPFSGRSILARDLERRADERGGRVTVRGEGAAEWVVHCVADRDVLERRARGQRLGVGPLEELTEALACTPAHATSALVVDQSNPLRLHVSGPGRLPAR